MKYNLRKQNNTKCKGNENMIRKNYVYMNDDELAYIQNNIDNINTTQLQMTLHAEEKQLISIREIRKMIRNKQYDIIDYNYFIDKNRERYLLRTKKTYMVKDEKDNTVSECYCKIVIDPNIQMVVTIWANKVEDEERKQNTLKNKYNKNFDIINKIVKAS